MSLQTWRPSQLYGIFLAFNYLVLRFNRSSAGLPHHTGAQLIMILYLLRGHEKPLEPVHPRVRFTLKKKNHTKPCPCSYAEEIPQLFWNTEKAASTTGPCNASTALSVVFPYTLLKRSPTSTQGLRHDAHHAKT